MGSHNSLEIYISLTLRLHRDIAERYPIDIKGVSAKRQHERDEVEILNRVQAEGICFLTKTLPQCLGKALDRALNGHDVLQTPGFKSRPGSKIPSFLGVLFERVFNPDGYPLRQGVDTAALRDLRTLAYFCYKLELSYDKETEQSVLQSFIETEDELHNLQFPQNVEPILEMASEFIASCFHGLSVTDIRPRHGPGSVATGEIGAEKSTTSRSYRSLSWYFPEKEYFFLGQNHLSAHAHWVKSRKDLSTGTAKVVLVPKDSRGPRLISCEPLEIQWIQQGILAKLVRHIERHPLTKGQVNFTSQEINRQLALAASRGSNDPVYVNWAIKSTNDLGITCVTQRKLRVASGDLVTLDMKDASDRVSLQLVKRLFRNTAILGPLLAARSSETILPDGRRVKLAKFAPMGSATCFPIEAMCFFALAVASLVHIHKLSYREAAKKVFVYGDDIIVDREVYPVVMRYLPLVGLRFNEAKCCTSGLFRESCGCDAYNGVDVTPIRLRKVWNHRGDQDPEQLVSWVSLSNSLRDRGYIRASDYVRYNLVVSLYGPIPFVPYRVSVEEDIPSPENFYRVGRVIGFRAFLEHQSPRYYPWLHQAPPPLKADEPDYQRKRIFGYFVKPVLEQYRYNGWNELFRTLVCGTRGAMPGVYAVPHRCRLKRGYGFI